VESVSTSDALVQPWRRATVVACTVAGVELLALLTIGAVLLGGPLLQWAKGTASHRTAATKPSVTKVKHARKSISARKPAAVARPKLARTETSVLVLNGNGIAGAAADEAQAVRRKGYVVASVGNAPRNDYRRTLVLYRPGYKPEAARLARDLHARIVSPLDGLKTRQLFGAHVAVILGTK
jgi:LytR cell envelope-related transcriptional attenuator